MKEIQEELKKNNKILLAVLKELKTLNMNYINNSFEFPEMAVKSEKDDFESSESYKRFMKLAEGLLDDRRRNNKKL